MTFHEDGDVVSVWVGSFESRSDLDAYLHPFYSPGPETDDLPLSAFAADIGLPWYDEDFLEADCCPAPIGTLASALDGFSYSSSFAAAAVDAVHGAPPFNTVLFFTGTTTPGARARRTPPAFALSAHSRTTPALRRLSGLAARLRLASPHKHLSRTTTLPPNPGVQWTRCARH